MPETTAPATITPTHVADWITTGANVRDTTAALAGITAAARHAADTLATADLVTLDIAPGNGYAYDIVIAARTTAFGPELILALPEFGRAAAFSPLGAHVPHYTTERLNLGLGDPTAYVLAAFLTILNARIDATPGHRLRG